jgi:hypothetical protein
MDARGYSGDTENNGHRSGHDALRQQGRGAGSGYAGQCGVARQTCYRATVRRRANSGGGPMTSLVLPEHLELLLTNEPVLDLYHFGPWRVPDGLEAQVADRARELAATPEAKSLRVKLPSTYRPQATAVVADLVGQTGFLCGVAAIRGGSRAGLEFDLFGEFMRGNHWSPPDPLQWAAWRLAARRPRPSGHRPQAGPAVP